jgi:hypothetical protein
MMGEALAVPPGGRGFFMKKYLALFNGMSYINAMYEIKLIL